MAARVLQALLLLAILSVVLSACGGGGDASTSSQATAPAGGAVQRAEPGAPPEDEAGGDSGGAGKSSEGSAGKAGSAGRNPRALATDPESISDAIVTATGAVQTLAPSQADRQEAMRNSYSSIKAFGEEASGSEATDITFALVQYLTAKAEGEWSVACARLYSVLRDNLEKSAAESSDTSIAGGGCPAAYGSLMESVPASATVEAARVDVASVRRGEDDRAFVIYKTPDTLSADMPMYLEQGVWTVGALEAYALTPEQAG